MPKNPFSKLNQLLRDEDEAYAASVNCDFVAEAYPAIFEEYGNALEFATSGEVKRISESFFAELLGPLGHPENPVVYLPAEARFYQYSMDDGIYAPVSPPSMQEKIARLIRKVAKKADLSEHVRLAFTLRFSKTFELNGVIQRAKAVLASPEFFDFTGEMLAVANGVLNLSDGQLAAFGPKYHLRNKLGVSFDPAAKCPRFLTEVIEPMMAKDDVNLFQRWCGLALGKNESQVLLIIIGPGGSGKGVLSTIVQKIIGRSNISELRTAHLGGRFEHARFVGKTLLVGSDVSSDFLDQRTASAIKSLTGHDPISVEVKGSHEQPTIEGKFNVLITSNALPRIRLDSDESAWKRRSLVIQVAKKPGMVPQHDLAAELLREEGPGILNWMIEGRRELESANYEVRLTEDQKALVDQVLGNSDTVRHFVDQHLELNEKGSVTAKDLYDCYVDFCGRLRWSVMVRQEFTANVKELIEDRFSVFLRHDVPDAIGRDNRGWRGIACSYEIPRQGGLVRHRPRPIPAAKAASGISDSSDTISSIDIKKKKEKKKSRERKTT